MSPVSVMRMVTLGDTSATTLSEPDKDVVHHQYMHNMADNAQCKSLVKHSMHTAMHLCTWPPCFWSLLMLP